MFYLFQMLSHDYVVLVFVIGRFVIVCNFFNQSKSVILHKLVASYMYMYLLVYLVKTFPCCTSVATSVTV